LSRATFDARASALLGIGDSPADPTASRPVPSFGRRRHANLQAFRPASPNERHSFRVCDTQSVIRWEECARRLRPGQTAGASAGTSGHVGDAQAGTFVSTPSTRSSCWSQIERERMSIIHIGWFKVAGFSLETYKFPQRTRTGKKRESEEVRKFCVPENE
jgi:hypothetical protein